MLPDFNHEILLMNAGFKNIAGVDEVGRGPLAGPVVAAAVILDGSDIPYGLNDSKKLSPEQRDRLYELILASSVVGIASIPARDIDRINILQSSLEAMHRALNALSVIPDYALIDGRDIPENLVCTAKAIVKGDAVSQSIAAASIVAKVTRDRIMAQADKDFCGYGFASNKGYGSKSHLAGIAQLGSCPLHRMSFSPFRK